MSLNSSVQGELIDRQRPATRDEICLCVTACRAVVSHDVHVGYSKHQSDALDGALSCVISAFKSIDI